MMKKYRMPKDLYKVIMKDSKRIVSSCFVCLYSAYDQKVIRGSCKVSSAAIRHLPYVGIVASRKVGGAVQRNRCKRLLRAAVGGAISVEKGLYSGQMNQQYQGIAPAKEGGVGRNVGIVLIARQNLLRVKFTSLTQDIMRAFKGIF